MPCLTALNLERCLPSGVLGPVLFWALRRLISARSTVVLVVAIMEVGPGSGCSGRCPRRNVRLPIRSARARSQLHKLFRILRISDEGSPGSALQPVVESRVTSKAGFLGTRREMVRADCKK